MHTGDNRRSGSVRKLGAALFVLALLATLLGIFHLIENWRGKKQWESYKRQLIAEGAKLDLASFIPAPIPAEQNFAAAPFFAGVLPGPMQTNWWDRRWPQSVGNARPKPGGKPNERQLTDFIAWGSALRARGTPDTNSVAGDRAVAAKEVLAAMNVYEAGLAELRAAGARPESRYDIEYDLDNPWGIRLPHLPVIKRLCQDISSKACAELAAGNAQRAMEDVRLLARITHSMDTELFLINYMVKVACLQLLVQPIWEGLALGRWSDHQLEELQRIMSGFNFVEDLQVPLAAEQAASVLTADILLREKNKAQLISALFNTKVPLGGVLFALIPRGWFYMEQYNCARLYQQFIWPGFDATNRIVNARESKNNEAQLNKLLGSARHPVLSHTFLARQLLPAIGNAHRQAAQAQTAAHQGAIACALERYRRKHGDYPMELAALAPEFMTPVPHDVIAGKPMAYKRAKPFVLYSIGWDDQDNGGTPGKILWDERGDWVWTYPQ